MGIEVCESVPLTCRETAGTGKHPYLGNTARTS